MDDDQDEQVDVGGAAVNRPAHRRVIVTRVVAQGVAARDPLGDCAGSGSMRSTTTKATATSRSWSTTTPDVWSNRQDSSLDGQASFHRPDFLGRPFSRACCQSGAGGR